MCRHRDKGPARSKPDGEGVGGRKKKRVISKAFVDSSDENYSDEGDVSIEKGEEKQEDKTGENLEEEMQDTTVITTSESSSSEG